MRLKAPKTSSTPRRALGAPQPKLRREVAERALQRPRARRAARLGVGRRLAPHQTPALGLGQRPRHAHARLDGAPRRRVGLVARVRRLAPYLSRVERDDPRRRGPRRRPGVLERRARAGGVEAPPGRAVEDDLLAAQRVLDRAAQRLVGVVSAVYGDGDVVDRAAVCVRYPDIQTASNSGVHDEYTAHESVMHRAAATKIKRKSKRVPFEGHSGVFCPRLHRPRYRHE